MDNPYSIEGVGGIPGWFINAFVFLFGSIVGSFLNVCIYRLPQYKSIVHPRSFCPACGTMIPFTQNIPLVSYILLRGRARCCNAPFSVRYWVVELITAMMFLSLWMSFPAPVALCYMVFASFLIVSTATDLELYIIPNEITWGSVIAGLLCSAAVPALQGEVSHLKSAGLSLAGFLVAFLVLWGVVEGGKLVFGRKKVTFEEPTPVTITEEGLSTPEDSMKWEDIFSRVTDQLVLNSSSVECLMVRDGREETKTWSAETRVVLSPEEFLVGEEKHPMGDLKSMKVVTRELTIPREAMGFGDVKLIGGIGAFLGAGSIFFVILASSLIGSVVGLSLLAMGKREWGGKLPYGPYLSIAAVIWMYFGPDLIGWYRNLLM